MSLTVILADYLSGTISTSDALRRSGFTAIDELVLAVRDEAAARQSRAIAASGLSRRVAAPMSIAGKV